MCRCNNQWNENSCYEEDYIDEMSDIFGNYGQADILSNCGQADIFGNYGQYDYYNNESCNGGIYNNGIYNNGIYNNEIYNNESYNNQYPWNCRIFCIRDCRNVFDYCYGIPTFDTWDCGYWWY